MIRMDPTIHVLVNGESLFHEVVNRKIKIAEVFHKYRLRGEDEDAFDESLYVDTYDDECNEECCDGGCNVDDGTCQNIMLKPASEKAFKDLLKKNSDKPIMVKFTAKDSEAS